jgi:hypothetical protein
MILASLEYVNKFLEFINADILSMHLVMLVVCNLKNLINLFFIYLSLEIEDVFELCLGNRSTSILFIMIS